jgi:hypothetical protein
LALGVSDRAANFLVITSKRDRLARETARSSTPTDRKGSSTLSNAEVGLLLERAAPIVGHQSPMKSRFAAFLCVMAVFQLIGGHWAVLQVTAWVGMLVKYSEAEGVEVGISKTFDGKHPCSLCLSIAKNKQTEKKQSSQLAAGKIYLIAHAQRWTLQPPRYSWCLKTPIASLFSCDSSPPVPPPRVS